MNIPQVTGDPPAATNIPPGCRFHPRCPLAHAICRTHDPASVAARPDHRVACWAVTDPDRWSAA
jgi:peptide/nickel transport system ATP-binding protein